MSYPDFFDAMPKISLYYPLPKFRQLWQARVYNILLEYGDDPEVFLITPV